MLEKDKYVLPIVEDGSSMFCKVRKNLAFYLQSNTHIVMLYGASSLDLLNKYSVKEIKNDCCYTLFFKKNHFINEAVVYQLSPYRYLVASNSNAIFKLLNRGKRKCPFVTVDNVTDNYSILSFHGDECSSVFSSKKIKGLYPVKYQNYFHYHLIVSKPSLKETINHYIDLGFVEIHLETLRFFLYNNNIITNLHKISKKYRNSIFRILCSYENHIYKGKDKFLAIVKFEVQADVVIANKMAVYNQNRKKIGYIHSCYKIANKNYPVILAVVRRYKMSKFGLIKVEKREIVIKKI